jgi:hypothetical protein
VCEALNSTIVLVDGSTYFSIHFNSVFDKYFELEKVKKELIWVAKVLPTTILRVKKLDFSFGKVGYVYALVL